MISLPALLGSRMGKIAVTALVDQDVNGRSVNAGDVFEVLPVEAAVLNYQQKVRLGGYVTKVETSEQSQPPESDATRAEKPRRRYRRRDMTADPQ